MEILLIVLFLLGLPWSLLAIIPFGIYFAPNGSAEPMSSFILLIIFCSVFANLILISKTLSRKRVTSKPQELGSLSISPDDYIEVSVFSKAKDVSEEKVISMIKDGFYSGRVFNGEWKVHKNEL